jgi:hypothetical protein
MDLVNTQTQSTTQLFAGDFPRVTKAITILTGLVLVLGTLLGKILLGAATAAAKTGGNTGDGTLTMDATTPILARAKVGVYTVRCIAAAANAGTLRVTDPEGYVLGDVAVGGTFANQIKFATADGATDFIVGDGFDITIAAGSGKYKAYDADNVDGSQYPELVLAEAIDSTAGDQKAVAYASGHFNEAAVTGVDANAKALLVGKPIFFGSVV